MAILLVLWRFRSYVDARTIALGTSRRFRSTVAAILLHPPVPVGSANDVAVTSPDVTRCHGMSHGDRERSR